MELLCMSGVGMSGLFTLLLMAIGVIFGITLMFSGIGYYFFKRKKGYVNKRHKVLFGLGIPTMLTLFIGGIVLGSL